MERRLKQIVLGDLLESILKFLIVYFITWILLMVLNEIDLTKKYLNEELKSTGDILVGFSLIYGMFFAHDFYKKFDNKIFKEFNSILSSVEEDKYDYFYESYEFKTISKSLEKKKRELEKKDEELIKGISYISHDMKTPITVINTNISLIKKSTDNMSDKNLNRMNKIYEESKKISEYIGILMRISKSQIQENKSIKISINSLIDSIEKNILIYSDMLEEEIKVYKYIDKGDKAIYANPNIINECIIHLLNNAYEYKNNIIEIIIEDKNSNIEISVVDDGCGFDEDTIEDNKKIFFTNNLGRTQGNGYGIGLFFVNSYMEKISGELKLFNKKQGAVAKMLIPMESDDCE